jgi:hypothetical protein
LGSRCGLTQPCTIILSTEISMALFKLPLSGDVVQWINPVTWFMSGNQITANVYLGESSAPEVEEEVLHRVGTYGRQLGQVSDAMIVLLKHLPNKAKLPADERKAIAAFEAMAYEIADIKENTNVRLYGRERACGLFLTKSPPLSPSISEDECTVCSKWPAKAWFVVIE